MIPVVYASLVARLLPILYLWLNPLACDDPMLMREGAARASFSCASVNVRSCDTPG